MADKLGDAQSLMQLATTLGRIEQQGKTTNEELKDIKADVRGLTHTVNDLHHRVQLLEPKVKDHDEAIEELKDNKMKVTGGIKVLKVLAFLVPIIISFLASALYVNYNSQGKVDSVGLQYKPHHDDN